MDFNPASKRNIVINEEPDKNILRQAESGNNLTTNC